MSGDSTFLAVLHPCQHVMGYCPMPAVHDTLYCRRCGTWRVCIKVEKAWRLVCRTRACTVTRNYGADLGRIRRDGLRHLRRYPDHDVWIFKGLEPWETIRSGQDSMIVTESLSNRDPSI